MYSAHIMTNAGKRFTRTIEDFVCERCGANVSGNGYTNHCPECLWSKHVDIFPGDRAEKCRGMMEPVGLHISGGRRRIVYRCATCGAERRFDVAQNDSEEALIALSKRPFRD